MKRKIEIGENYATTKWYSATVTFITSNPVDEFLSEEIIDDSGPYIVKKLAYREFHFNSKFDQNAKCDCGHPYYRHFDTYENNPFANRKQRREAEIQSLLTKLAPDMIGLGNYKEYHLHSRSFICNMAYRCIICWHS